MKLLDVPNILENFFKNKFESTIYQQNNITSSKQSVAKKTGYLLYKHKVIFGTKIFDDLSTPFRRLEKSCQCDCNPYQERERKKIETFLTSRSQMGTENEEIYVM